MKKNLLFTILTLAVVSAFGQKIPFQGKLIQDGIPVDSTLSFEFSIPSLEWSETHADVFITDGLYFVILGSINPLPDSLFYGAEEQSLEIAVDGTALSPVILFKPLSTPYEGNELNVRNSEGTVVGTLKARTDSVKHGELIILGENKGKFKAGFSQAYGDTETDIPYLSISQNDTTYSFMSATKWNNVLNGRIYLGSGNGDYSNIYPNLFLGKHNGRNLFQVGHASWNGSENFGLLLLDGPNSGNFEITGQHWDNPDLPFFKMRGSENQEVLILSAESDSLESGNLRIHSQNGNAVYMNADHANFMTPDNNNTYISNNGINIHSNNDKELDLSSERISLRHTAENEEIEMLELTSQDWGGQGPTGLFRVYGTTTQNFELTSASWQNPNLPWFKMSGENNYDAIQMSIENDPNEAAYINLNSLDGSSTSVHARSIGLRGPNSQNLDMGSKSWENDDFGYINMWGKNDGTNDFHAMEISVSEDGNGDQYGYINLMSGNGKHLHLSPEGFGVEGVGMDVQTKDSLKFGYLYTRGPNSTNFETGGEWDNPDRAFLNMNGDTDEHRLRFAIYEDGEQNEHGNIEIRSENNRQAIIEPDNFSFVETNNWTETMSIRNEDNGQEGTMAVMHLNSDEAKSFYANPRNIALRDDANGFQHLVDLHTNNDSGNGWAGAFNLRGADSDNINMGARYWDGTPDIPFLQMIGESDYQGMELSMYNDENGNQEGYINLKATSGRTVDLNPNIIAFHNMAGNQTAVLQTADQGQGEVGELRLNGANGNPNFKITGGGQDGNFGEFKLYNENGDVTSSFTPFGGAGLFTVFGETAGGIKSGFKFWEGEGGANRPFHALEGTINPNVGLVFSHIEGDNSLEYGAIGIESTDGSKSDINAYRIENISNDGKKGSFSSSELRFDENGDFMSFNATGIGGSIPIEILNGANITNDLNVNGNIIATGTITPSSDKRFKKNIQSIGITLQKVELLEGVSYDWRQDEFPKKNFSSEKQIGLIAQELETQFPELVKTDKEGYKSVNYNGFTAVLLEAVKELNGKVEKLEAENKQLRVELSSSAQNTSEISILKEQMEALVKMVQMQQTEENSEEYISTPGLK